MSQQPIGRNTPCPCGSGKKYKQCCLKSDFDWVEDDDGTIRRSIPISEDLQSELQEHMEGLEHDLGQKAGPDNLLFPNSNFEHSEHQISMAMQNTGVDPALVYAFEETGLLVSEENQDLLTDKDMADWEAAVQRYRDKHGVPSEPANLDQMPSEAEQAAAMEVLEQMDPEMMTSFRKLADQFEDVDEFIDMIMIGPCPTCESEATTHCEDDPEIDDATVGRCKDCKQLFCPDCSELFPTPAIAVLHDCPAWEEMEAKLDEPY